MGSTAIVWSKQLFCSKINLHWRLLSNVCYKLPLTAQTASQDSFRIPCDTEWVTTKPFLFVGAAVSTTRSFSSSGEWRPLHPVWKSQLLKPMNSSCRPGTWIIFRSRLLFQLPAIPVHQSRLLLLALAIAPHPLFFNGMEAASKYN